MGIVRIEANKVKGVLWLGLFAAIAIAGCSAESNRVEETPRRDEDTQTEETQGDTDEQAHELEVAGESEEVHSDDNDAENTEFGTVQSPYPFGVAHSRDASFLGTAWTISIDEVRRGFGFGQFSDVTEGECVAIVGTASVEVLPDGELVSNSFDFPTPVLIADGNGVESNKTDCDSESLDAEGLTWVLDTSVALNGTVRYYQMFLLPEGATIETIAIEDTVYNFN